MFTFSHRSERKISTNFAGFFAKFQQNLQNFRKFARVTDYDKNDEFSGNFESGAVRKRENLVDLEKSEKMRHFSLS